MKVKAILRKLLCSPKKVRLVVDKIRGLNVEKATGILLFVNKKSAEPVLKLLNSAIANAENTFKLKRENLVIKEIKVDSDGMYKRAMPRARGMSSPILKRLSRIELTLEDVVVTETVKEVKVKKVKKETAVKTKKTAVKTEEAKKITE